MSYTEEQSAIIQYISEKIANNEDKTILINAVAGAGKTFLLTQIVQVIPHTSGIYLAYNKSVAVEASAKFPKSISCSTCHSLAYRAVVKQLDLRVGNFSYKNITEKLDYEDKLDVIDNIREFCLSKYTSIDAYSADSGLSSLQDSLVRKYLGLMYEGSIECTHDFYMKAFHMHLADGSITYPKQDFLLIDEAGDLNEVTLEVFKLLPAKIKIAVGDSAQNIYSFNHTVNAFELLKDVGVPFRLTESFRVSADIASRIEKFCTTHIADDMAFKGQKNIDKIIETRAILSRTNGGLISTIIDLMASNTKFSLVRKASDIFKVPLMLCFLKYQGTISEPAYRHLQSDVDDWYESSDLKIKHKTPLLYLLSLYDFDQSLVNAGNIVIRAGTKQIMEAYEFAKACENSKTKLTLATCHSVKGLEFDEVLILDDLNNAVGKVIFPDKEIDDETRMQELNLYYVACSRAKKSLLNAQLL